MPPICANEMKEITILCSCYLPFVIWQIPPDILPTQQRPHFVLINESSKSIIIIERTVPFEQNMHKAYEHKLNKYAGLTSDLQEQSYDTKFLCVEFGSRGLITDSNVCFSQYIFAMISNNKNLWNRSK